MKCSKCKSSVSYNSILATGKSFDHTILNKEDGMSLYVAGVIGVINVKSNTMLMLKCSIFKLFLIVSLLLSSTREYIQ